MSLSDEERVTGLYHAVHKMVGFADQLKEKRSSYELRYDKLLKYADQLWHSFIGGDSNGMHWIMGSSASNEVGWDTSTPWGIAINHHCEEILKEESEFLKGRRKEVDAEFDAFENFLDIEGLLSQTDQCSRYVYALYGWSEQAIYYLRRYKDDFLEGLDGLSRIISNIQGECFGIFKSDDVYAHAYVLHAICKMLYEKQYPYNKDKWDVVTRFFQGVAAHHDLSRMMESGERDLKILAGLHVKLYRAEKEKKLTKMMRLEAFLTLSGRRFHYDHQFKDLSDMLVKDGFKKADIDKLQKMFKECQRAHEENEKKSHDNYERDRMGPLTIYGLDYMD